MNRGWLALFLLAVAAWLASAAWWWQARDEWQPPAAQLPQLPDVQPLPAPQSVAMRQALARPLLWESRRPVRAPDEAPVESKAVDAGGELADATLEAVLASGGQRLALLRSADGETLKVGADPGTLLDALPNWRLEAFDGSIAVFVSNDGQRVQHELAPGGAPPATGAAAAGAATRRAGRNKPSREAPEAPAVRQRAAQDADTDTDANNQ